MSTRERREAREGLHAQASIGEILAGLVEVCRIHQTREDDAAHTEGAALDARAKDVSEALEYVVVEPTAP